MFDPSLPSCAEAILHEQATIDVARKKLAHPEREIVPDELARVYLPLTLHIKRRQQPDAGEYTAPPPGAHAGEYATPAPSAHVGNPQVRARAPGIPAGPVMPVPGAGAPDDDDPAAVYVDREEEKDFDDSEDEAELRRQARILYGDQTPVAPAGLVYSSSPYLQPNFAVLYVAIVAFVVLLVGKRRRSRH